MRVQEIPDLELVGFVDQRMCSFSDDDFLTYSPIVSSEVGVAEQNLHDSHAGNW